MANKTAPAKATPKQLQEIYDWAKAAGAKYPRLVVAQFVLESGWGTSFSGAYNPFGLKASAGQAGSVVPTKEEVGGVLVQEDAKFIDFPSVKAAVEYLVKLWYKDYESYKGVNNAANEEAAAYALRTAGYMTDSKAPTKLIALLKQLPSFASQIDIPPSAITPAPNVAGGAGTEPVLFTMEATQATWLKKSGEPAAELEDNQKIRVEPGKRYGVIELVEDVATGHSVMHLASNSGTWYVWPSHWRRYLPAATETPRVILTPVSKPGRTVALAADVDWTDFGFVLTPGLTVGEVLQWDPRRAPAPNSAVAGRVLRTVEQYAALRSAWAGPIGITSWLRPEPINSQVGGVPGSWHVTGEAFDSYPVGKSLDSYYQWLATRWAGGLGDGRPRGFVHTDTNGQPGAFVPGAGVRPARTWLY
jgi:hypothetical protein